MTIDEAIKLVREAISKRVANGGPRATIEYDGGDKVTVRYADSWNDNEDDEYTATEFVTLVEEAKEYAGRFEETEFDAALEAVGLETQ